MHSIMILSNDGCSPSDVRHCQSLRQPPGSREPLSPSSAFLFTVQAIPLPVNPAAGKILPAAEASSADRGREDKRLKLGSKRQCYGYLLENKVFVNTSNRELLCQIWFTAVQGIQPKFLQLRDNPEQKTKQTTRQINNISSTGIQHRPRPINGRAFSSALPKGG